MSVRIMSSNVWGNCPPEETVSDRNEKLARVFLSCRPDFLGLQECSPRTRSESAGFDQLLHNDYTELPVTVTNDQNNNFTPIYYRSHEWKVLESGWHYYTGRNDQGSKSITWGVFERIADGKRLLYFNTHYYWRPDAEGHATRLQNTRELLALYEKVSGKFPCPAFFTGDFNSATADEPIVNLLAGGIREARSETAEPVVSVRSYHRCPIAHIGEDGVRRYTEGFLPDDKIDWSIDHIFCAGSTNIIRYETVLTQDALQGSDHCPIYIDAVI